MWPVKHIDLKIKRSHFEALSEFLTDNYNATNIAMNNKEAYCSPIDVALHTFTLQKFTYSFIQTWRDKKYDKLYNFRISVGFAMMIHMSLNGKSQSSRTWQLDQAHERIFLALNNIFSIEMLKNLKDEYKLLELTQ